MVDNAEEKISKLEDVSTEMIQNQTHREKKEWKEINKEAGFMTESSFLAFPILTHFL